MMNDENIESNAGVLTFQLEMCIETGENLRSLDSCLHVEDCLHAIR